QGTALTLDSLVRLHRKEDAVEINHSSLFNTTNVLVNTENRDLGSVAAAIQRRLKRMHQNHEVPQGLRIELKGEYARMNESFRHLLIGLALASLLVYLL